MRLVHRFVILFLVGGITGNGIEAIWSKMENPLSSVWRSFYSQSTPSDTSGSSRSSSLEEEGCTECAHNKIDTLLANDPILTEFRVEYVKQQILKKLRLSKPPEISMPLSTLPKPLINGRVLELRPGAPLEPEKSIDSFYGKTDQIVVFPNEG